VTLGSTVNHPTETLGPGINTGALEALPHLERASSPVFPFRMARPVVARRCCVAAEKSHVWLQQKCHIRGSDFRLKSPSSPRPGSRTRTGPYANYGRVRGCLVTGSI
jgi:hypothetical protein